MVNRETVPELAHTILEPDASKSGRYMLFAHGILGTRANWRSVARRVIAERSGWGAVLVDLREHGDSLGREPPHTVQAAAEDLVELEEVLGIRFDAALGHSFGGKVVLEWSHRRAPDEVWAIDSLLGDDPPDDGERAVTAVLRTLRTIPQRFPDREAFVNAVVSDGHPAAIAQWLAMNLQRDDDRARVFGPDLDVIDALLESYARTDTWPTLEESDTAVHVVVAGKSTVFSEADRHRLARLSAARSNVHMHVVAESSHWVHVDAPDMLVELLAREF